MRRSRAEVHSLNVLPVLLDLSPSIKTDLPAPGGGSSVDTFARVLDRALSGPSDSSAPSSSLANAPYEPPTKSAGGEDATAVHRRQEEDGSAQRTTKAPARDERRDAAPASGRPSRKPERADRHPQEKTRADASSKAAEKKPTGSEKGASNVATQKIVHDKKAGKNQHVAKAGEASMGKPTPFPGAIILGSTDKEVKAALDKAVKQAAGIAKHAAKPHSSPPQVSAKATPAPVSPRGAAGGKQTQGGERRKADKKPKAALEPGAKSAQAAALLQPGPTLLAESGGNAQQAAAANATHDAPGGQAAHPAPAQNGANAVPALTVIDLRHSGQEGASTTDSRGGQNQSSETGAFRLFQLADGGTNSTSPTGGQAAAARAGGTLPASQGFAALTDHIVKQTGILLKDNNSGEIRLVLKPENLGQLRIKIDMVNNNLTGKIFVQNHDALRLVQQNLDGLYRALRDSGFTATQLNVSVGGRESHERQKARSSPLPLLRAVEGLGGFDGQTPAMEAVGRAHSLVNLVI